MYLPLALCTDVSMTWCVLFVRLYGSPVSLEVWLFCGLHCAVNRLGCNAADWGVPHAAARFCLQDAAAGWQFA
jgi:hypothetical protein